jgi:DNA mismatch repair ATPase MutS
VFDELYSGTNPYEAIGAAIAFLKYLKKYKNMSFMITTHFLEVCKRLDNHKDILNCNMDVNVANNDFTYTYKMEKGISKIKGAVKVLKDLDYPEEIINETKEIIETLNI